MTHFYLGIPDSRVHPSRIPTEFSILGGDGFFPSQLETMLFHHLFHIKEVPQQQLNHQPLQPHNKPNIIEQLHACFFLAYKFLNSKKLKPSNPIWMKCSPPSPTTQEATFLTTGILRHPVAVKRCRCWPLPCSLQKVLQVSVVLVSSPWRPPWDPSIRSGWTVRWGVWTQRLGVVFRVFSVLPGGEREVFGRFNPWGYIMLYIYIAIVFSSIKNGLMLLLVKASSQKLQAVLGPGYSKDLFSFKGPFEPHDGWMVWKDPKGLCLWSLSGMYT